MGYRKTERLGGLEVKDHLKLGRELHREIARLFAAQDAIDIGGGATVERTEDAEGMGRHPLRRELIKLSAAQ